jgi:hypothetical protein
MSSFMRSALVLVAAVAFSCGRLGGNNGETVDYNAEAANAAGEQMAAIDEGAAGSGIGFRDSPAAPPAPWKHDLINLFTLPSAYAASCTLASNWMCSTTVPAGAPAGTMSAIVGDFSGGCSSGGITLTGKTEIDFSTSSCHIPANGDYLIRFPNYTFNALGYTLAVSVPSGGGQKLMRTGLNAFEFTGLGVERVATDSKGKTLFDIETTTGSPVTVTGSTRAGRTVNGGSIVVEHKLAAFTTTLVPNNLTWSSGCNCPTSGSLAATNSGSRHNSFTITMGPACGDATISGSEADGGMISDSVSLQHCHAL